MPTGGKNTKVINIGGGANGGAPVEKKLIGDFSTTVDQTLDLQGAVGVRKVGVGSGVTTGGEITVDGVTRINTCNIAGNYDLLITVRIQRTGASGVSIMLGRIMYAADGVEGNAVQVGGTFGARVDDADTTWRESFEVPIDLAAGGIFWIEFGRDEAGVNAGDIGAPQPTGTLAGWNPVNTAAMSIYAFKVA